MDYLVDKPPHVGAETLVLVAPTSSKYVHYAHRIGTDNNWKTTDCGVGISKGYLWSAFHATIAQSRWCRRCW